MADLICDMNCIHRSKRPLRKWKALDGSKSYGCSREYIVVGRVFDPGGDIKATAGEGNMASCASYEPIEAREAQEQEVE